MNRPTTIIPGLPCDDMLSNPTTSLHDRQRRHRRQQSTPTAYEGVKIPTLPNTHQRQAAGHRRGLSLDIRRQQMASAPRQDHMVSTNTNLGIATTSQHRVLREAQQQRIQACPGPQQHHYASLVTNDSESYLISPHGTPHAQRFDTTCFGPSSMPFDPYGGQMNALMQKNQGSYLSNISEAKDLELFATESTESTPTFLNFPESPTGWTSEGSASDPKRPARRISNGIMDGLSKFETLGMEELSRPATPPNLYGPEYSPPTPTETPHGRLAKQKSRPDRFSDHHDESMEETIKPNRRRMKEPAHTVFDEMRQQAEQSVSAASTPSSSTFLGNKAFGAVSMQAPDYMSMNPFKEDFMKMDGRFEGLPANTSLLHSSSDLSQHMAADAQQIGHMIFDPQHHHELFRPGVNSGTQSPSASSSLHRRTDSVASIVSAASIADINIDETRTETGVTLQEISQYIRSPEIADGKWTCLFEDCGKQFGRKENIKSHVQTHLNDRQYQCPTCKKCFVRQHDLKRHAKIHTGIKPYPCECGNSFARHDALTRHRQRGMCIGAFDGVVRKVVKRGRPKKNRPDMDTRLKKSSRTRKKNMSVSSMSSRSGYSDSSGENSPDTDYNMLDDLLDMGINAETSLSSAPMPSMASQGINEFAASPSSASTYSYVSPEAIMDKAPSHAASPANSTRSRHNTPPELTQSSSPQPAQFLDLEHNTATGGVMMSSAAMSGALPAGISEQDDNLLLQFTNEDGLGQLDRDPSMMMMAKFDEEFDRTVSMFTNNDDVFFGNV